MGILEELLKDVPIPKVAKVRQVFDSEKLEDPEGELRLSWSLDKFKGKIEPGAKVAIAVGSRGINKIAELTAVTVSFLKEQGAEPFIVPAMGSHGGATAEGQKEVLAHLGITEESAGCRILSSMDVVQVGELPNGLLVYVDKFAYEADGIVVINRVKPHTAFRGKVESGIMKMISIGLGKQKGAEATHQLGFKHMAEYVPMMANVILNKLPFLFAVATVENAYDQVAKVEVPLPEEIEEREPELLVGKELDAEALLQSAGCAGYRRDWKNISGDGWIPTSPTLSHPICLGRTGGHQDGGLGSNQRLQRKRQRCGNC